MKKTIGVLGGIGPEATGEFYNRLIAQLQAKKCIHSNADYPHMLINSIPARELYLENANLSEYVQGVRDLERFGADFIVIVCNTAHLFWINLQQKTSIPIVDLREEVKKKIKKTKAKKILFLGTKKAIDKGLYIFKGAQYVFPSKKDLQKLDRALFEYNNGRDKEEQARKVMRLIKAYADQKTPVFLGCTELSVMLKNKPIQAIDPLDILAEATIREWKKIEL